MSLRMLLRRGLLAGLGGGTGMAAFLLLLGEPWIRRALMVEAARSGGAGHEELFSRDVQIIGGVVAALLYGALLGLIFAIVYAATTPGNAATCRRVFHLGWMGYLAIVLVPALKYPANPPGVGDPYTIGSRTAAYVTLLMASILFGVLAWRGWLWLHTKDVSVEFAAMIVAACWGLAIGIAYLAWPASPDPVDMPAQVVWHFRLATLAGAFVLWTAMSIFFAWPFIELPWRRAPAPTRRSAPGR